MVSRHRLYLAGFAISGILLIGAGSIGVLEALSAVSGGAPVSGESAPLAMLSAAAEWMVAVLVLGLLATVFLAASVVSFLRSAFPPRDDRLASVAAWFEERVPALRQFDVSGRVEPTTEDRKRRIKDQYVSGEIGEAEFERRLSRLMDDPSGDISRSDGSPGDISRSDEAHAVETENRSG